MLLVHRALITTTLAVGNQTCSCSCCFRLLPTLHTTATQSLQDLQKGVADTMNNLEEGFPGPLVKDVLDVIKTQSDAAADEIKQVFDNLTKDYPNLDPKTLMNGVEATLEELLSGSEGPLQLALLTAADPSAAAKELTGQIPVAFQAVNDALVGSQGVVKALLPAELGDVSAPVDALRATTPEEAVLADELQQVCGHVINCKHTLLHHALHDAPCRVSCWQQWQYTGTHARHVLAHLHMCTRQSARHLPLAPTSSATTDAWFCAPPLPALICCCAATGWYPVHLRRPC